jgi:hypothetical protein
MPVCLNLLKRRILEFGSHCKYQCESRTEIHFISFHIHSYPFTSIHTRFHTLDFISHQFTLNFISFHTQLTIHFILFQIAFTIQFTLHFISFHIHSYPFISIHIHLHPFTLDFIHLISFHINSHSTSYLFTLI